MSNEPAIAGRNMGKTSLAKRRAKRKAKRVTSIGGGYIALLTTAPTSLGSPFQSATIVGKLHAEPLLALVQVAS